MDYRHEDPPYPYAQVAQTKAGWLAQICVRDKVVWESSPLTPDPSNDGRGMALKLANARIADAWEGMFA